jgi:hypothetical protein
MSPLRSDGTLFPSYVDDQIWIDGYAVVTALVLAATVNHL